MITYRIETDCVWVITDLGNGLSSIEEIKNDAPEYEEILRLAQEQQQ